MSTLADFEALYRNGEAGAECMTVDLIKRREIWAEMKWPEVTSIKRQVKIGRAIADVVVWHSDGSVTIIEVKRAGLGLRDYCTGIGQLAYQALMAMSDFQAFTVRRVLAMPGQFPVDVALACISAEVDMLPMCTIDQWIEFIGDAIRDRAIDG